MRSALALVAFSNASDLDGVIALLETALAGLDRDKRLLAAAYVDMALAQLMPEVASKQERLMDGIVPHQ